MMCRWRLGLGCRLRRRGRHGALYRVLLGKGLVRWPATATLPIRPVRRNRQFQEYDVAADPADGFDELVQELSGLLVSPELRTRKGRLGPST
jgi:hypothetical protein